MIYHYNHEIPEDVQVLTLEEFKQAVKSGAYNKEDGSAIPARDGRMAHPNLSAFETIPEDATHIVWIDK